MIWVLAVRCADQLPSSVRASGRSVPSRSEYIPGATSGGGSSGRSVLSAAQYVPGMSFDRPDSVLTNNK